VILKSPKGDLKVFDVSLDHPFSLRDIRLKAGDDAVILTFEVEMVYRDSVQRFKEDRSQGVIQNGFIERNNFCVNLKILENQSEDLWRQAFED
jgi:hypothetical protein